MNQTKKKRSQFVIQDILVQYIINFKFKKQQNKYHLLVLATYNLLGEKKRRKKKQQTKIPYC